MGRNRLEPYVPISPEDLPRMVGKSIHLRWANRGCTWILVRIDGDVLHLRTPRTRRELTAKARDACYTRANEPKPF